MSSQPPASSTPHHHQHQQQEDSADDDDDDVFMPAAGGTGEAGSSMEPGRQALSLTEPLTPTTRAPASSSKVRPIFCVISHLYAIIDQ